MIIQEGRSGCYQRLILFMHYESFMKVNETLIEVAEAAGHKKINKPYKFLFLKNTNRFHLGMMKKNISSYKDNTLAKKNELTIVNPLVIMSEWFFLGI
jgi:hypothetical protein